MDERERRRKEENEDIIRRMRLGDPLIRIPQSETWFPPRPLIVSDRKFNADAKNRNFNVISFPTKRKPLTETD
jgi:hypothetical protein